MVPPLTPPTTADHPPEADYYDNDLVGYLERDQLEESMHRPAPPKYLGTSARVGLWLLRVFVIVISVMVIYTFVIQLH
jgi:hypothetical protein